MPRRKNALLLGNGINYLSVNSVSWTTILRNLAKEIHHEEIINLIDEKPFTLIYEEIIFKSKNVGSSGEIGIKRKVAKLVDEIKTNSFHEALLDSKFKHIITTNYDYALERSSSDEAEKSNLKNETKYNLFRRKQLNDKYIWHIHGESDVPNSITLGHEQYAGQLQKMRAYATANRKTKSHEVSQFKLKNKKFDTDGSMYSWLDVFLRDNIHILGLSLDYTEIDLWWLLSYKERLRQMADYTVGETYFHTIYESRMKKKKQGLLCILESFGVKIIKHDNYRNMYESVING